MIADGPFGLTLAYDLNEDGWWKLIVAGSNMQGDDYTGDFILDIEIE